MLGIKSGRGRFDFTRAGEVEAGEVGEIRGAETLRDAAEERVDFLVVDLLHEARAADGARPFILERGDIARDRILRTADVRLGESGAGAEPDVESVVDRDAILDEDVRQLVGRIIRHGPLDVAVVEAAVGIEILAIGIDAVDVVACAVGEITDRGVGGELGQGSVGVDIEAAHIDAAVTDRADAVLLLRLALVADADKVVIDRPTGIALELQVGEVAVLIEGAALVGPDRGAAIGDTVDRAMGAPGVVLMNLLMEEGEARVRIQEELGLQIHVPFLVAAVRVFALAGGAEIAVILPGEAEKETVGIGLRGITLDASGVALLGRGPATEGAAAGEEAALGVDGTGGEGVQGAADGIAPVKDRALALNQLNGTEGVGIDRVPVLIRTVTKG